MSQRNFYDVLGIKKTANENEIKTAFRRLVRQYHPDVSDDPNADDKVAELNNAYETLSDPKKRRLYDAKQSNPFAGMTGARNTSGTGSNGGEGFHGFGDFVSGKFASGRANFNWADIKEQLSESTPFGNGSLNLDDILATFGMAGKERTETHKQRYDEKSNHQGKQPQTNNTKSSQQSSSQSESSEFEALNKVFRNPHYTQKGDNQQTEITVDLASVYTGDIYSITLNVPVRQADGEVTHEQKKHSFSIPKGTIAGDNIRLTGQGSASLSGGENGDLLLNIKLKHDDNIRIDGVDVYQTVDVMPWQVALNEQISVNTPAGQFDVTIPENSQSGSKLRLKSKGIPAQPAGDLYLVINITNPEIRTSEQLDAFVQLKQAFTNDA